MKRILILIWIVVVVISPNTAQTLRLTYTTELQYSPTSKKTNSCTLLRTDWHLPVFINDEASASTLHIFRFNPNCVINDLMTFSNIEEQNNPIVLNLFGYTKKIGKSILFLGIRNVNEDYFNSPITSHFTNSACGIFPTISVNYPIANYPYSGLCLHYNGKFNQFRVKGSLYNGIGYNGWNIKDNPFIMNFSQDGIFGISELNYQTNHGIYFCGISVHTNSFVDTGNFVQRKVELKMAQKQTSFTWWCYAEQQLFKLYGHQVNMILQYSENNHRNNYCKRYFGIGFNWFYENNKSSKHNLGLIFNGAQFRNNYELHTEVTYNCNFKKNFLIQPAIHLIKNNAGRDAVFLIRFSYEINLKLRINE
ncbi:MAG: hypothetical protein RRY02_09070 [Muribaculaceae bacterium]